MKFRLITAAITGMALTLTIADAAVGLPAVNEKALRAAMDDYLKDAESARFKQIKLKATSDAADLWLICGSVNSKNSFGAYEGHQPFFVMGVTGTPKQPIKTFVGMTIGDVAQLRCSQEGLSPIIGE